MCVIHAKFPKKVMVWGSIGKNLKMLVYYSLKIGHRSLHISKIVRAIMKRHIDQISNVSLDQLKVTIEQVWNELSYAKIIIN